MSVRKILIGADPEVFVRNRQTKQLVSAHGLLPGTKEEPFVVPFGAVQIDGMATEFNIDPASNRREFVRNVQKVFESMTEMLPDDVELVVGQPCAHFDPSVISEQPHEALMLGCEPDYNAYTGEENPTPAAINPNLRTAAGHIHIGWTDGVSDVFEVSHFETCMRLVRHLDATVGVSSLLYDTDTERRSLYGKAGAFRPKPYGVEYRVLSNAWLCTPELMAQVYDQVVQEVRNFFDTDGGLSGNEMMCTMGQAIIDNSMFDKIEMFDVLRSQQKELIDG